VNQREGEKNRCADEGSIKLRGLTRKGQYFAQKNEEKCSIGKEKCTSQGGVKNKRGKKDDYKRCFKKIRGTTKTHLKERPWGTRRRED